MFAEGGGNEHDAIAAMVKKHSVEEVAKKLAEHYGSYVTEQDWDWLKNEAGVTAIRLPVGYWHVGNGKFIGHSMKFHDVKEVYAAAKPWDYVHKIIEEAGKHDIGVLIDLHGLPGGANGDDHSGENNGGSAKFFGNHDFVKTVVDDLIPFVVKDVCKPTENVIGLQVVNEAAFSESASHEKKYYAKAIKAVLHLDDTLPVVISDGWWPLQWADWLAENKLAFQQCSD